MVLQKVESNIKHIIIHCLHQLLSTDSQTHSQCQSLRVESHSQSHFQGHSQSRSFLPYLLPTDITRHFPSNMNVVECQIIEQCSAGWQIKNDVIECSFGLKVVFKQKSDALHLMQILSECGHHGQTQQDIHWDLLFLQPAYIETLFTEKSKVPSEWKQMENGILCRFRPRDQWHEFAVIPFVECTRFDLKLFNKTQCGSDDIDNMDQIETIECSEQTENEYNDWYYEQYMDYYQMNGTNDGVDDGGNETMTMDTTEVVVDDSGGDMNGDYEEDLDLNVSNANVMSGDTDRKRRLCRYSDIQGDGNIVYESVQHSQRKKRRISGMTVYS